MSKYQVFSLYINLLHIIQLSVTSKNWLNTIPKLYNDVYIILILYKWFLNTQYFFFNDW